MNRSKRLSPLGVNEIDLLQAETAGSSSSVDTHLSKRYRLDQAEEAYNSSIFDEIVDSREREFVFAEAVSNGLIDLDDEAEMVAMEQTADSIGFNSLLRYFKPVTVANRRASQHSSSSSAHCHGSSKQTDMSRFLANHNPHVYRMETSGAVEPVCINSKEESCRSCHASVDQDISTDSFTFARCSFCASVVCSSDNKCSSCCFLCGERFCKFCVSSNYTLDKYEVIQVCIDCNR